MRSKLGGRKQDDLSWHYADLQAVWLVGVRLTLLSSNFLLTKELLEEMPQYTLYKKEYCLLKELISAKGKKIPLAEETANRLDLFFDRIRNPRRIYSPEEQMLTVFEWGLLRHFSLFPDQPFTPEAIIEPISR